MDPRPFEADKSKVGFAASLLWGRAGEVVTLVASDVSCQETMENWEKFKEYLDLWNAKCDIIP